MNGRDLQTTRTQHRGYLFVAPWELRELGGVDQVIINLWVQAIRHGDFDPVLLINRWDAIRPSTADVSGRTTIYFRIRSPLVSGRYVASLLAYAVSLPATLRTLHFLLRRHSVRVVNVHYPGLAAVSFLILQFLGLFQGKLILSMHGSELRHAKRSRSLQRFAWRILIRRANAVVACSRWLEQEIRKFVPEAARITCIHNGVDRDYMEKEKELGFSVGKAFVNKRLIASVANFEYKKGQDTLLEAVSKVRQHHPDVHLVLIGAATKYLNELQAIVYRCGIQDQVSFVTDLPHRRVSAYLERACLFVLASREEPFGIAILEAGLYRLPVIASAVGGIPEILEHELTALLVPPDDPATLAREIDRLLRNPDLQHSLGERLHQRVLHDFSWERAYQKYLAVVGL